jgi:dienelactone hydrolase
VLRTAAALLVTGCALGLLVGCGPAPDASTRTASVAGTTSTTAPPPTAPPATSTTTRPPDPVAQEIRRLAGSATPVELTASDGVGLRGHVFGAGATTVVLSHMGARRASQEDWFPVADALAAHGYRVVTYDRRGVCSPTLGTCSDGPGTYSAAWQDVAGVARYARETGAERVVLGGASLGAMSTFWAVSREDVPADGLVWFAGVTEGEHVFDEATVAALPAVPVLYLSSEGDRFDAARDATVMASWTRVPHRLVVLPGRAHGTELTDVRAPDADRRRVVDEVLALLADVDG